MKKTAIFLFLLFSVSGLSAQTRLNELYANSIKCHQRKQYECFLRFTYKLDSIRPSHPAYTYNLACAYGLNNMPGKAFATLEKSILMDYTTEFENEPDLESLRNLPDYQKMLRLKTDLQKEIATSAKVTTLSEKDLHPEGLVYLEKKKLWLASSVRKGKIVSFDPKTGKCSDWLNVEGTFSVMAMKPDADEKYLWVATAAMEQWSGFTKSVDGKSAVLKIDIRSRKIVQTFTALGRHVFGDLAIAKKTGTVYISDSFGASIYKIDSNEITHFVDFPGPTFNFQGMTLSADESKMYLADYFSGIMLIDLKNGNRYKWMDFPPGTVTKGIDGLTWYGNSLIAIHNGIKPIRIIRYFLDASGEKISHYTVIDNNRPEFHEPTSGFAKDKKFFFFANCPWPAYDKSNNLDESKYQNPMLYSFGLE